MSLWKLGIILLGITSAGCGGSGPPRNRLPQPVITVSNPVGYAPLSVTLDASQSTDADGSIVSYFWQLGDGSSYSESQVSHTFRVLGQLSVTLTVTDNDGGTSNAIRTIDVYAQIAGFYSGDFLGNVPGGAFTTVFVHVGTNHKFYAYEDDSGFGACDELYWGDISMNADSATGTLLAELQNPICTFPDGTTLGTVDVIATVVARNLTIGSYIGVGDNGTLQLFYISQLSERGSSLADISGVWSYSDGLGYMETMVVQNNGDFTLTDTDGCVGTGRFAVMDTSLNEYNIEYDLSCPAGINVAGDGRREGIAFIDDIFFVDDYLEWNITFLEGPLAGRQGGSALSRPAASSVTGSFSASKRVQPGTVNRRTRLGELTK